MWSIPDKGEGDSDIQSVLVEGISGKNCVLSGGAVTWTFSVANAANELVLE